MFIRVQDNAAQNYITRCYKGAHPSCGMAHSPEWADTLKQVEGQWLEVETEHLFENQFNTVPIPGVSDNGLRLFVEDISEIKDDVREGVVKCRGCLGYDRDGDGKCDSCGREDYLHKLNPIGPYKKG
jgi:hypothetical protein